MDEIQTASRGAAAPQTLNIEIPRFGFAEPPLFAGLSLRLPAGRWSCLLGASGVGKTTLLRLIAGLLPGAGGAAGRVAYMAQRDLLLPWLGAVGNATLGARLRGERPHYDRARALLARLGLAGKEDALPQALSGGERQRVALARTLMEDAPLVLMDEPFSALDAITRARLQELAVELLAGRTVLLVTHDPWEAARLGEALFVMSGRPARLDAMPAPTTPIPRDAADPALARLQAELMRRLATVAP